MQVVCDIETDALENPKNLWCIVCKDIETRKDYIFDKNNFKDFPSFAANITLWIGHNFIAYDRGCIYSFLGVDIPPQRIIDTLVVSRLLDYSREGKHSLEQYGREFGYPKEEIEDFSVFSEEIISRCVKDVEITFRVFQKYKQYIYSPIWRDALRVEHDIASLCVVLHDNGFPFKIKDAKEIHQRLSNQVAKYDVDIAAAFPPIPVPISEVHPKGTKYGTLNKSDFRWEKSGNLSQYSIGAPFTRIEWREFNPRSTVQIVQRLNAAGWKPFERTDGYLEAKKNRDRDKLKKYQETNTGWSVSEENLKTLPDDAPEGAKVLSKRLILDRYVTKLEEWINLYREDTGCIHGVFNPIGSWTHRMSHTKPNMANPPSPERWDPKKSPFDADMQKLAHDMRALWYDECLVGTDADAIHSRILAHLIDDKEFTQAHIDGDKTKGTDIHTLNAKALGDACMKHGEAARARAKTFYYSFMNGAKVPKVAEILECSFGEAEDAINKFIRRIPGLQKLLEEDIPRYAHLGYFQSLDGRYVPYNKGEHGLLSGVLQNGEKIVMARACILWHRRLLEKNIPFTFRNFVHDEWQTGTKRVFAEKIGTIQADAIRAVGVQLSLRCPLAGNFKIGTNWAETH